jgi:phosphatidylserine decarboxylase
MAREAWLFLLPLLAVASISWIFTPLLGITVLALAGFVAYFFRDPERSIPTEPGALLSPADGTIVSIQPVPQPEGIPVGTLVSIFLSVFDVHINRAPITGKVIDLRYQPGAFRPAFQAAASTHNEQNVMTLQDREQSVVVKQIAGILARRIVCRATIGDQLAAGQRFGLIRFGSRVDVLIPANFVLHIQEGDRVRGGESIIAREVHDRPTINGVEAHAR